MRRVILWGLIGGVAFIAGISVVWFSFYGEEYTRQLIVNRLRPAISPTLNVERISLNPHGCTLSNVSVELSPLVKISISAVKARFSYFKALFGDIQSPGSLSLVTLESPTVTVSPSSPTNPDSSSTWTYMPHPLKSFSQLGIVRRMLVSDGVISTGESGNILVDSINGEIDLTDISVVPGAFHGRLRGMTGSQLEIQGTANLPTGDFSVNLNVMVADLHELKALGEVNGLDLSSGQVECSIDFKGDDSLRIKGSVRAKDISGSFHDNFQFEDGQFEGVVSGKEMTAAGEIALNGVNLPVIFSLYDPLLPAWSVEINAQQIDLSEVGLPGKDIPEITGTVGLELVCSGERDHWNGLANLYSSSGFNLGKIKLDSLRSTISLENSGIRCDDMAAYIMGIVINSVFEWKFEEKKFDLKWKLQRNWEEQNRPSWCRFEDPELHAAGVSELTDGGWKGWGKMLFLDGKGKSHFSGKFSHDNSRLNFTGSGGSDSGRLEFAFNLLDDGWKYRMSGENVQELLTDILAKGIFPDFLQQYDLNLQAAGNKDQMNLTAIYSAESGWLSGWIRSRIYDFDQESLRLQGTLGLDSLGNPVLSGEFDGGFSNNTILLDGLTLKEGNGRLVFTGSGSIPFKGGSPRDLKIIADGFPLNRLLELLKIGYRSEIDHSVDVVVETHNDTIFLKGQLVSVFPDSVEYLTKFESEFYEEHLSVRSVIVTDSIGNEVLSLTGTGDIQRETIDSLVLVANAAPVNRLLKLVFPVRDDDIDGLINAIVEVSGDFSAPRIETDIHMVSGTFFGIDGYWGNFRLLTQDSLYWLENVDFGMDVHALVRASGFMNRFNRSYRFDLLGRTVKMQSLFRALAGVKGPVSGLSNFEVTLEGGDTPQRAEAHLVIEPGSIGKLKFDSMVSRLRLTGMDLDEPVITIDSVLVDWGDAKGRLMGEIPLNEDRQLSVSGSVTGVLPTLISHADPYFSSPGGTGQFMFLIGGTVKQPRLKRSRLELRDGSIKMKMVIRHIDGLNALIELKDSNKVDIIRLDGLAEGNPFRFTNYFPEDTLEIEPIIIGGYNLGVIQFATGSDGIWAVIPGFMDKNWGGHFVFRGYRENEYYEFRGPADRPLGIGEILLRNSTFTYPFLRNMKKPSAFVKKLLNLLERMKWHTQVVPDRGCRYVRDLSQLDNTVFEDIKKRFAGALLDLDVKVHMDLFITDNPDGLVFTGSLNDTLRIRGDLTSVSGTIEYLDMSFEVDEIGILFNPSDDFPMLYGSARTYVFDESGNEREIRLVLYGGASVLPVESEGQALSRSARGRWGDFTVVLEDDQGSSQERILAMLGYAPELLQEKLPGLGVKLVGDVIPLRRWTGFIERQVERWLNVDRVEFESTLARNFIEQQLYPEYRPDSLSSTNSNYLATLDGSRFTLGKYLTKNLYLSYTGLLHTVSDAVEVSRLGMIHDWDLALRLARMSPNLRLNYRYEYDSLTKSSNSRWFLRYSFVFDAGRKLRPAWLLK